MTEEHKHIWARFGCWCGAIQCSFYLGLGNPTLYCQEVAAPFPGDEKVNTEHETRCLKHQFVSNNGEKSA